MSNIDIFSCLPVCSGSPTAGTVVRYPRRVLPSKGAGIGQLWCARREPGSRQKVAGDCFVGVIWLLRCFTVLISLQDELFLCFFPPFQQDKNQLCIHLCTYVGKGVELRSKCTLCCSACRAYDKLTALCGASGLLSVAIQGYQWTNSSWRCSSLQWGEHAIVILFSLWKDWLNEYDS